MTTNSKQDKKSSKLNITNVRNLLKKANFNPNSPGPLSVVAHSGNPSYFETRALEYIEEAKLDRMAIREIPKDNIMEGFADPAGRYERKIIRAIQMLTIAVLKVQDGEW